MTTNLAEAPLRQARNSAEMFPLALLEQPGVDVYAARGRRAVDVVVLDLVTV